MIDELRIDDKTKYGTRYDVGNITLYVTSEFWGGRWHIPTIQLSVLPDIISASKRESLLALDYDTLTDIVEASRKSQREWLRIENWRAEKKSRKFSENAWRVLSHVVY